MTERQNMVPYLIYPENKSKGIWDLVMTIILLTSCVITPLDIAFGAELRDQPLSMLIINGLTDSFFAIDMLLIFNTAYYNEEVDLIENRKIIAHKYFHGWFTIDLMAIIPFDVMIDASGYNSMARIARIGRLYKLAKLMKLFRIFKVMKEK